MGLVVYWVTTNLWTVGQGLVTRRLVPKTPAGAPKRSSRTPARQDDGDDGAREAETAPKPVAERPVQPRKVKRKKRARR
jgi:membrane protein insertase Oxa1/YidC/SpoIIIJ